MTVLYAFNCLLASLLIKIMLEIRMSFWTMILSGLLSSWLVWLCDEECWTAWLLGLIWKLDICNGYRTNRKQTLKCSEIIGTLTWRKLFFYQDARFDLEKVTLTQRRPLWLGECSFDSVMFVLTQKHVFNLEMVVLTQRRHFWLGKDHCDSENAAFTWNGRGGNPPFQGLIGYRPAKVAPTLL